MYAAGKESSNALGLAGWIGWASGATTGGGFFVECLGHSAKTDIHSAKPLPSVRALGKQLIGKDLFVECTLSGTPQRLC